MILLAVALAMAGATCVILAAYLAFTREGPHGRHSHAAFADPADSTDPDGSVWLSSLAGDPDRPVAKARELHHELSPFPAAGMLEMLPPDPPLADTIVQAIAVCELGMPTEEYLDGLFADAEREIGVLASALVGGGEKERAA